MFNLYDLRKAAPVAPPQPTRVPSPPLPRASQPPPPETVQSKSTSHLNSGYQLPPGYTGQPLVTNQPPPRNAFELSSAIGKFYFFLIELESRKISLNKIRFYPNF